MHTICVMSFMALKQLKPAHLQLILRIAETGQLQTAAHAVAMSQPAASRVLADIERSFATRLFERTPKGMEITRAGETFVRHSRVLLSEMESVEKEIRDLSSGVAGEVRVGTVTAPAVAIVCPVLQEMRKSAPHLSVTVEVGPSRQLVQGLYSGRLDLILARLTSDLNTHELLVHPARSEVIRLIVGEGHPLANERNVPLASLVDYDWVIQEPGSPVRDAVEEAFHLHGTPTPTRVVNSSSLLVAQALLASSDIISPQTKEVTNLLLGEAFGARLRTIDLREAIAVPPYFVIRNRNREFAPAAQDFYERVLKSLSSI